MPMQKPVIAIFDIGKTNKKLLLLDEQYRTAYEERHQLAEIKDEDGFSTEDIAALTDWIRTAMQRILGEKEFHVKAIQFSAYGASFVYLDRDLNVFLPLYNYLKPFPPDLHEKFYSEYGRNNLINIETASPDLGCLNSGLQLYRIKNENPKAFKKIQWALHLPNYLSFLFSSALHTDLTSIGCHTMLWDFPKHRYHSWVSKEGLVEKFPDFISPGDIAGYYQNQIPVGIGIHDSSAALIPYLVSCNEPFVLISTGTWNISMNPFNHSKLSPDELNQDCLCYLSYEGMPVKSSRLFAGFEHEKQVKELSNYFQKSPDHYTNVSFDARITENLRKAANIGLQELNIPAHGLQDIQIRELSGHANFEEAYHQLIADIIEAQVKSTKSIMNKQTKKVFVDGGFSSNALFMNMLAEAFSGLEVYAAKAPQASALGAALCIHQHWNSLALPGNIIELKRYWPTNINSEQ